MSIVLSCVLTHFIAHVHTAISPLLAPALDAESKADADRLASHCSDVAGMLQISCHDEAHYSH